MKRNNVLRYILELIVILGNLVIGVAILTYIFQGVPMDRVFLGSLLLTIGVIGFTEFFTWRYVTRVRSIQSLVASIAKVGLGASFIIFNFDNNLICILIGACSIAFALIRIVTATLNITRQPLLNGVRTVISITEIVFAIILIIRTQDYLRAYMTFVGIALAIEAFVLLIEFMVHRYQRI